MIKERKGKAIEELKDKFARSTVMLVTDYRGLSAKDITALRRHLDKVSVDYKVVKNTLAVIAARQAAREKVEPLLDGPVAVAIGYEDQVKPARSLVEFIRISGSVLQIKGGLMGDRLLSSEDVVALAALPSKEVLIAQLMGQLRTPAQLLHNVLTAPLRGIVGVLQARVRQLEGQVVAS